MDFRVDINIVEGKSDSELTWAVIEPLWKAIDSPPSYKKAQETLSSATKGQRLMYAIDWWQKELRNGGPEQFFKNSSGALAHEAALGLHEIEATCYAELLEHSLTIFPDNLAPASKTARTKLIQSTPKAEREALFDSIEERFFMLLAQEETGLESFIARYIRANPEQFFLVGGT